MSRTFTKSDTEAQVTYTSSDGIVVTIDKTGASQLKYSVTVDIPDSDTLFEEWSDFVARLESENTVL